MYDQFRKKLAYQVLYDKLIDHHPFYYFTQFLSHKRSIYHSLLLDVSKRLVYHRADFQS